MMRVLSVRQPWASAIIYAGKDVENRSRSLGPYRGPVAIHASTTYDDSTLSMVGDHPLVAFYDWNEHAGVELTDTEGHIIGVVDLVDAHDSDPLVAAPEIGPGFLKSAPCSPWADQGAVHLVLADPRALAGPIPFKGALGLRVLPAEVEAEVLRRLA